MTVAFLTSLDIRDIDDHNWQLIAPFCVDVDGVLICAPAGMITDFASVPRLPLAYMLLGNIGHRAAVIHDHLYASGEIPRADADAIFRAILLAEGVSSFRAGLMYAGVRVAGGRYYNPTGASDAG